MIDFKNENVVRIIAEGKHICGGLALAGEHYAIDKYNQSSLAPYHNWYHLNCMIKLCYEAATFYNLPHNSVRALACAALCHDVNHGMGSRKDSENIEEAVMVAEQLSPLGIDLNLVKLLIRTTEYPYVIDCFSIEQRIIRDCDLLQCTMPCREEMCIHGLAEEMGIKDLKTAVLGQLKFMSQVKDTALTEWAHPRFAKFDRIAKDFYHILERQDEQS